MIDWLAPVLGGAGKLLDFFGSKSQADKNIQLQKDFAQQGIRWKVADAKAAGIHPLYALGAQTHSFAPVSVGSNFGDMGQDISRAINATRTQEEKDDAYTASIKTLDLQNKSLQNDLLASQIRKLNAAGTGPPLPSSEKAESPQRTVGLRTPEGLIITNQNMSDQQAFEDRYGEVVGEFYGLRNWYNEVGRPWIQQELGKDPWRYNKDYRRY